MYCWITFFLFSTSEYRDNVFSRGGNETNSTDDQLPVLTQHILSLKIQDNERTCCFSTLTKASKCNVIPVDLTIASSKTDSFWDSWELFTTIVTNYSIRNTSGTIASAKYFELPRNWSKLSGKFKKMSSIVKSNGSTYYNWRTGT